MMRKWHYINGKVIHPFGHMRRCANNCCYSISIGQPNRPIEALLSACALGILHDDIQLSELVLKELKEYERDARWCHHIAFLTSELYLKMVSDQSRCGTNLMLQTNFALFLPEREEERSEVFVYTDPSLPR